MSATPRFRQGAGRLCLDFVRTLRHRGSPDVVEELPDAEAVLAWVRQCGPCADATGRPDAADARALREAVHTLLTDARAGQTPDARSRDTVNSAAAQAVPVPRLTSTGQLTQHADDPVRATLALVARDALDLVTSPSLARLRTCAGPACGALFLDISRPGNRRWCSMGTCGNRAKKETLRGRTV
ncbi:MULTISPECIES: CGNR zinc finger domain-containing protein [unclassified Streptomyces]|uniref:CGNR zinc finger domain-containing protein n=1 Tax=unclassified Streptomyces TaxID=2593676 RepID=UPI002E2C92F4|nr:CGNR zinc finger domain-containing protein [Streptomyces sp. NBC_00228]